MAFPLVQNPVLEIIGVVADTKNRGIRELPIPEVFVPSSLTGWPWRGIVVRVSNDPARILNAIQQEIWAVDRNVAMTGAHTLPQILSPDNAQPLKTEYSLRSLFDQLADFVAVAGQSLEQREQKQLGAALLPLSRLTRKPLLPDWLFEELRRQRIQLVTEARILDVPATPPFIAGPTTHEYPEALFRLLPGGYRLILLPKARLLNRIVYARTLLCACRSCACG